MTTLVLVGCGAAKRDEPAAARDLYTSTYFALKWRYAETLGDYQLVLSAEHGAVHPGQTLEPYDTTMDDVENVRQWSLGVLASVAGTLDGLALVDDVGDVEIVVLAGADYVDPLRDRLESLPCDVRYPFDETSGIGDQMGWLSDELAAVQEGAA